MAEHGPLGTGEEGTRLHRDAAPRSSPDLDLGPTHPLLRLQRQAGNQAVARLLVQRQTAEDDEEEQPLQTRMDPALQRQAAEEEEEEEEGVQRKPEVGLAGGPVGVGTAARIQALRGGGESLAADTQATMERAFGTSFADVRIHTGSEASELNRRLGAQAFTTGSDIYLRDDVHASGTAQGQGLLSHELTHVVQQRSMPASGSGLHVRPAGDHYEQAADRAAEIVARTDQEPADREP